MAGKRQKPPGELQGHRAKPGVLTLAPNTDAVIPTPPRGLHPVARKAWRLFWSSPVAQVLDVGVDDEAVRRWAYCLSERELLEEQLRETPLVRGSQGQLVRNPLFSILQERIRELERYREQFGMTPLARMRLGIAYSEADAALDRMHKRRAEVQEPVFVELPARRSEQAQ